MKDHDLTAFPTGELKGKQSGQSRKYKAFLSYSHAADERLTADVQSALHTFAKRWTRLRAIRTFRDTTNLAAAPSLWGSITKALDESEFFILMASPEAAHSPWVEKEVTYWLKARANENLVEKFMIVLTDGCLVWNDDISSPDFDWQRTNALPSALTGVFQQEPRYVDLTWARTTEDRSLRNSNFRAAIADLATPLHGKDKDELYGEDVRQYHKAMRFRRLAFVVVMILLVISLAMTFYARGQSKLAIQNQLTAQRNAETAKANEARALQQQHQAEENLKEAETQREKTRTQTRIATEQKKEAERQQQIATRNESLARVREKEALKSTAEAKRKNYLANIAYATSVDEKARISEFEIVKERLASLDQPLRRWEWEHLRLGFDNSVLTIAGEDVLAGSGWLERVADVSVSPDGSHIASVSSDYTVRLWDAKTGANLFTSPATDTFSKDKYIRKIAFSPDGSRLVSGSDDGTVRVWSSSGEKLLTLHHQANPTLVKALAFSPDGEKIFSLTAGEFRIWNARTGEQITAVVSPEKTQFITFDREGSCVLETVGEKLETRIRDFKTNRIAATLQWSGKPIQIARFSFDGGLVATTAGDKLVRIWDAKSGQLKFTLSGLQSEVENLAFSPDDTALASASYEGIRVWGMSTGEQITWLKGHRGGVTAVGFGPDNNLIVSGGEDATVRTWSLTLAANISLPQTVGISYMALSHDAKYMTVAEKSTYQLNQPLRVYTYDLSTLRVVNEFHPFVNNVVAMDLSPDDHQLALVQSNGVVRILEPKSGDLLRTIKGKYTVLAVSFSSDGKHFATATREGYITVWNTDTWLPSWEKSAHDGPISQIRFSPNNESLASASSDKTIKLWETKTGQNEKIFKGHDAAVFCVSFNPDGKQIASGSYDGTVKIWSVSTGMVLHTLVGHTSGVNAVVFSFAGDRVFSASSDSTVRIWDAETGDFLSVLREATDNRNSFDDRSFGSVVQNANFGMLSLALNTDGTRLFAVMVQPNFALGSPSHYLMIWSARLPRDRKVVSVQAKYAFEKAWQQAYFEEHRLRNVDFLYSFRYDFPRLKGWDHELRSETALALNDNSAASYLARGIAYGLREDYLLAIPDFTEAIRLSPNDPEPYGQRGSAYYKAGYYDYALKDLTTAVSMSTPNLYKYMLVRGMVYFDLNKLDEAIADFGRVIDKQPGASAYDERHKVYLKKGEYNEAISDLTQAIRLKPDDARLYNKRGWISYQKADLSSALDDFRTASHIDEKFIPGQYNLACVLYDSGRFDESLIVWDKLMQLIPKETRVAAGKAITLAALGRREQALPVLTTVLRQNKDFWTCETDFADELFWAKSGCRAIAPLAQELRTQQIQ